MLWSISVPDADGMISDIFPLMRLRRTCGDNYFFQYLKVIVIAIASASSVVTGKSIGEGDRKKSELGKNVIRAGCLYWFLLGRSFVDLKETTSDDIVILPDTAMVLGDHLMIIMSIIMVGNVHQMPVSVGNTKGGDTRFNMYINLISTWDRVDAVVFPGSLCLEITGRMGSRSGAVRSDFQGASYLF